MKCDLSSKWKEEISVKEWHAREELRKNAIAEAERRIAAEKKELEKEGWEFCVGEFTHPHNNDSWLEQTFKSPRMPYHRSYYSLDVDFRKEEAKAIAHSFVPRFLPITQELIESQLANYFYENPKATTAPKLKINIIDDQENKISCVVG